MSKMINAVSFLAMLKEKEEKNHGRQKETCRRKST